MMGRRAFGRTFGGLALRGVAALASLLVAGCEPGDIGSSRVYFEPIRYRLTAQVETPQGVKTGYSVIQTIWDRGVSGATVTGEAVAVDLGGGQTLFVLLRSQNNADWAAGVPGVDLPGDLTYQTVTHDELQAKVGKQVAWYRANRDVHYLWGGTVPKNRAQYLPYFVRFANPADPKSVEQVDPNNLAKSYGAGYALKSLTVQITDEAVTSGIEKRLGWLGKMDKFNFENDGPFDELYPPIVQYLRFK